MSTGVLYTSYYSRIRMCKGLAVAISRYVPKRLDSDTIDNWVISLAPSESLLYDYKYKGLSWEEYCVRYVREMKSSRASQNDIEAICQLLEQGYDVTLYCYEKDCTKCHRSLLGNIIRQRGYTVKEIGVDD